jgi:hypothetical protein
MTDIKDMSPLVEWLFSDKAIKKYNQNEYCRKYNQRPEVKQYMKEYNNRPEGKEKQKTYVCEKQLVDNFVDRFGRKFVSYGELKVLSKDYSKTANIICGRNVRSLQKRILSNRKIQERLTYINNTKETEVYKWNIKM